jgi:hypothetical protein
MAKLVATILLTAALAFASGVNAQNLDMSRADRSSTFDQPGKPTRGMTQANVEANFGAPQKTVSPVGDPPITRWEYAGFVVYFEYDKVIHSVTRH